MKTRQELKLMAKQAIGAQRKTSILVMLVLCAKLLALVVISGIVACVFGSRAGSTVSLLILVALLPLMVGVMVEFLNISRRKPTHVMRLYSDYFTHFGRRTGGMLWMGLWACLWAMISIPVFLLSLWMLRHTGRGTRGIVLALMWPCYFAALIPAFVKGLSYAMTPFILADQPDVSAREALKRSMHMMAGRKLELFKLALSFIGWMILSGLTLGVLYVVYVGPYYYATLAGFYDEVKDTVAAKPAKGDVVETLVVEVDEPVEDTDDVEDTDLDEIDVEVVEELDPEDEEA